MHQLATKVSMAATVTVFAAALAGPGPAFGRPAARTSKKAFSGNLCSLLTGSEVAAANITASCVREKTSRTTTKTLLGSVTRESFKSHWGTVMLNTPDHYLLVVATRYTGSPAALAKGRKEIKVKILGHGAPASGNPLASVFIDTGSCVNPPTNDCTHANLMGLVKDYLVQVFLYDYPPTGPGELVPGEDEPQDMAQEETDKAPTVSIFKAVAAKL
jgi:hypothetical protein